MSLGGCECNNLIVCLTLSFGDGSLKGSAALYLHRMDWPLNHGSSPFGSSKMHVLSQYYAFLRFR